MLLQRPWRGLKEQHDEEIDGKISVTHFLKWKMEVCFNMPWQDAWYWQLAMAKELPDLEKQPQNASQGLLHNGSFKKNGRFGGWKQGWLPGRPLKINIANQRTENNSQKQEHSSL
uniref:Uncharacterized protein n=1 Tax=Phasianus colchicus TaxID=9054 RepID=A0A669PGY8_PHACC